MAGARSVKSGSHAASGFVSCSGFARAGPDAGGGGLADVMDCREPTEMGD